MKGLSWILVKKGTVLAFEESTSGAGAIPRLINSHKIKKSSTSGTSAAICVRWNL